MKTSKWAIGFVLLSTLSTASGQILIKMGINNLVLTPIGLVTNLPLIVGYILYGLSAAILIVSLKYGELSVLYPIYALNFIWVSIMTGHFFPHDQMNLLKWAGVLAIVGGVGLIGIGSRRGK